MLLAVLLNIGNHLPQYGKFLSNLWGILCKNSLQKRNYSKTHLGQMLQSYSNQQTDSHCRSFERSLTWVTEKRHSHVHHRKDKKQLEKKVNKTLQLRELLHIYLYIYTYTLCTYNVYLYIFIF